MGNIMINKSLRTVFITGANNGIGYALSKILASQYNCHVFLGSRNLEKGNLAIDSFLKDMPECKGRIQLVQCDVSDSTSINNAANQVQVQLGNDKKLYALINNAGVGGAHGVNNDEIIKTNVYGVKLMSEAFQSLIESNGGRIVNMGSEEGPKYVSKIKDQAIKDLLSSGKPSWSELEAFFNEVAPGLKGGLGA